MHDPIFDVFIQFGAADMRQRPADDAPNHEHSHHAQFHDIFPRQPE